MIVLTRRANQNTVQFMCSLLGTRLFRWEGWEGPLRTDRRVDHNQTLSVPILFVNFSGVRYILLSFISRVLFYVSFLKRYKYDHTYYTNYTVLLINNKCTWCMRVILNVNTSCNHSGSSLRTFSVTFGHKCPP